MPRKTKATHTMPDGTVHPYTTHEEYVRALQKKRITKKYGKKRRGPSYRKPDSNY